MLKDKIEQLGTVVNEPCVTISLNTHRTHPDNLQDGVLLKNLLNEAKKRVIIEYGKRPVAALLAKINDAKNKTDRNYNLDSLHLFFSNNIDVAIRTAWPVNENMVHVGEGFALRPVIKALNRTENYLILLLSQGGASLYEALNDGITGEISNDNFPFPETMHYITHADKRSDPKQVDAMIREFLNKVDKALLSMYNDTGLKSIVISTEDNFSKLLQVADKKEMYMGYCPVDYNNTAPHQLAAAAWKVMKSLQQKKRTDAITEVYESVASGKIITDLQEIYRAAIDGKGDLLIMHNNFSQPVLMKDDRTFDLINDVTIPGAIDDIGSNIAWEVVSRKGRVIFTDQESIRDLGDIVMKTRY